eukprot:3589412-Prymnesium_polylepis.1
MLAWRWLQRHFTLPYQRRGQQENNPAQRDHRARATITRSLTHLFEGRARHGARAQLLAAARAGQVPLPQPLVVR